MARFAVNLDGKVGAVEQIVGRERREREVIADFQLPIVDLIRAAASTQPFDGRKGPSNQVEWSIC